MDFLAPKTFPIAMKAVPTAVKISFEDETGNGGLNYLAKPPDAYTFQKSYLWNPGFTKESMAPHMEYMGVPKQQCEELARRFQSFNEFWTKVRKKSKDATGLQEIFEQFPSYVAQLTGKFSQCGFKGREQNYAQMQLIISTMRSKFKDKCEEVKAEQAQALQVYTQFLTIEPWVTKVESLKAAYKVLDATTKESNMRSHCADIQNGVLEDLPSFIIKYNQIIESPDAIKALERLTKFMQSDGVEVYEVQIVFDGTVKEPTHVVKERLSKLCQGLKKGMMELFTLKGTTNIVQDQYIGHIKFATSCIQDLVGSTELQRVSLVDCYIDFKTLEALASLTETVKVNAIKMTDLKVGLMPPGDPFNIIVKQNRVCCKLHYMCCVNTTEECCNCCPSFPDHAAALEEVQGAMDQYREEQKELAGSHTGASSLARMFQNMSKHGQVDIIDFTGTRLPDLCGTVQGLNNVLEMMALAKPSAVCLNNTGLTDVHIAGICQLFFNDHLLLHFEVGLCPSDMDALEMIQNLVQNSPLIVSGAMHWNGPVDVVVAGNLVRKEEGTESACCLTFKKYSLEQYTHKYTFPETVKDQSDFQEFSGKVNAAIRDSVLVPMHSVLKHLYRGNQRKLKKLDRACSDETYKACLSPSADIPKMALFRDFLEMVKSNTVAEDMWAFETGQNLTVALGSAIVKALEDDTAQTRISLTNKPKAICTGGRQNQE
jgi:hypothetical protein